MDFNQNLKKFQNYLSINKIDFALVFSNDEFLKETSILNKNARYLLSGFSGTSGDMLVSPTEAFLFVDGRYHIQVDEQVDLAKVTPIKLQMQEKIKDKIIEIFTKNNINKPRILIPANKISQKSFETYENSLKKFKPHFIKSEEDIVCKFFEIKNDENVYELWNVGIDIVGKTTAQKIKGLKKYENDFLFLCSNDEICYLANIRSNQNLYSSSLDAVALVKKEKLYVFTNLKNISNNINYNKDVVYYDISEFERFLSQINSEIYYIPQKTPLYYVEKIKKYNINLKQIYTSPIAIKKAIKNNNEINYIKACYIKSDLALFKAISFLNEKIEKNLKITTKEFMQKLIELEKEQGIISLSFNPILALNERSAIIHCTEFDENQIIKDGDLILLDFGVYFKGGYATDMTRTFVVGKKYTNVLMKKVYTTVLKAFLNVLNYPIKKETTFYDLDKKARDIVKKCYTDGFSFNHGTGHGIGLNVHEMPPVLSPSKLSHKKIRANMIFSIEPGLYKENVGGVRLENSVYTYKTKNAIRIGSLNHLPFDEKLISWELLNKKEIAWLKTYQAECISD